MQENRNAPNPIRPSAMLWLLILMLVAFPMAAEEGVAVEEDAMLDTKTLICHPTSGYCHGSFTELIQWIKSRADGTVQIQLQPEVSENVTGSLGCTFSGARVDVTPNKDNDGGEENILNQLYISAALNSKIRLKFYADAGNICQLEHLFAYFTPAQ